ncbi:MAG: hypothetical protein ACP5N2_03825 [Candidatus Nanoarchaeia archaeon]
MRLNFNIYPETIQKFRDSGLEVRVQKLKKSEEGLHYIGGHISSTDLMRDVKWLGDQGYYKGLPDDFKRTYKETMNAMLNNPENFSWIVERPSQVETENCETSDLDLFTGAIPAMILTPVELWDYKKFGFESPTAFVGSLSAYITMQSRSKHKNGYSWTRKKADGSEIVTEITGDHNADLRVFQTDMAPYKTKDPFGNETGFRPETSEDHKVIYAYHSTEPSLFIAVLKYIEQQNIKTNFFESRGEELIKWADTLAPGAATCAEHFGGGSDNIPLFFVSYDLPIPILDKENCTTKRSINRIYTQGDGWYTAYISQDGNLIFSRETDSKNQYKNTSAIFLPEDAEEIIKGTIYQAARNLGRTSVNTMLNMLRYRFSKQFTIDQERYKQM